MKRDEWIETMERRLASILLNGYYPLDRDPHTLFRRQENDVRRLREALAAGHDMLIPPATLAAKVGPKPEPAQPKPPTTNGAVPTVRR